MYLPNKSHRRKYSVTQVSKQYPSLIRVIDISITVTQVSTQCPYPMVRVIDVGITVTQVSTQCPYPMVRVIEVSITVTQVSTQCS